MTRARSPREATIDVGDWATALERFAKAGRVTVSLFDEEARRVGGPYAASGLGRLLLEQGAFGAGATCGRFDAELADRCLREGRAVEERFAGALRVRASPVVLGGEVCGALVFGWCFERFTSSHRCARLARELGGIAPHALWSTVRRQAPIGAARFEVLGELLETLGSTTARQLDALSEVRRLGRLRDHLVARVSHDLRTPLQAVQMRLELMLEDPLDEPEQVRASLARMHRQVEQQRALVDDLVDASSTLTGRLRLSRAPVQVQQVVAASVEALGDVAEAEAVSLRAEVGDEALWVEGDPRRLQQVFVNLVQNAVKFTPEGGHVDVRVVAAGAAVEVVVQDSGRGLSPELAPRIFDAFEKQQDGNAKGLGLGLAIAREVVAQHDGEIHASSPGLGEGTTFTVRLPRLESARSA